jgi:hypothetical protein
MASFVNAAVLAIADVGLVAVVSAEEPTLWMDKEAVPAAANAASGGRFGADDEDQDW